jgi:hypothetical protein
MYGPEIGVQFPAGERVFSLFDSIHTGSGTPFLMGTAGYFPEDKSPGANLNIHVYLLPILRMRGVVKVKGKDIPVTGHEGPEGCQTSRLPHFLDNRLTDGGEVVSLKRRPPFTPRKIPGTHFC